MAQKQKAAPYMQKSEQQLKLEDTVAKLRAVHEGWRPPESDFVARQFVETQVVPFAEKYLPVLEKLVNKMEKNRVAYNNAIRASAAATADRPTQAEEYGVKAAMAPVQAFGSLVGLVGEGVNAVAGFVEPRTKVVMDPSSLKAASGEAREGVKVMIELEDIQALTKETEDLFRNKQWHWQGITHDSLEYIEKMEKTYDTYNSLIDSLFTGGASVESMSATLNANLDDLKATAVSLKSHLYQFQAHSDGVKDIIRELKTLAGEAAFSIATGVAVGYALKGAAAGLTELANKTEWGILRITAEGLQSGATGQIVVATTKGARAFAPAVQGVAALERGAIAGSRLAKAGYNVGDLTNTATGLAGESSEYRSEAETWVP